MISVGNSISGPSSNNADEAMMKKGYLDDDDKNS